MSLAGMLIVRKNSARVANKLLRPFGDTTLFKLALEKYTNFPGLSRLYLCAHEPEFFEIADEFTVVMVHRTKRSVNGETAHEIYDFLDQIEEERLVNINPCCPFLKRDTFAAAIQLAEEKGYPSMVGATEIRDWVCAEDGSYLNASPESINSKELRPLFKMTHPFTFYQKERMQYERLIWSLTKDDPHLFPISDIEAIDIDTMSDLTIAEALYFYLKQRGELSLYL